MKVFFAFKKVGLLFILVFFLQLASPRSVRAEACSNLQINGEVTNIVTSESSYPPLDIKFDISGQLPTDKFIVCTDTCGGLGTHDFIERDITPKDGVISLPTISGFLTANSYGTHRLHVRNQNVEPSRDVCVVGGIPYEIKQPAPGTDCEISVDSETTVDGKKFTPNTIIIVTVKLEKVLCASCGYPLKITGQAIPSPKTYTVFPKNTDPFDRATTRFPNGVYSVELQFGSTCNTSFTIAENGGGPQPSAPPRVTINPTCDTVPGSAKRDGINTALGCIPASDLNDFVGWLLKNVIFVASGIAFLLMAFGALQIITSAGSPDKMKAGSELITSALSGLLLIILSLFLLKLIGVDILQIPGFGN